MKRIRFQNFSLRKQLILIVSIAVVTNLTIQFFYFLWLNDYVQKKGIAYTESTMEQVVGNVQEELLQILNIGQKLAYSRMTQSFFTLEQEAERLNAYRNLEDMTNNILSIGNSVTAVALTQDFVHYQSLYNAIPLGIQQELKDGFSGQPPKEIVYTNLLEHQMQAGRVFMVCVPVYSIYGTYGTAQDIEERLGYVLLFSTTGGIFSRLQTNDVDETEACALDQNGSVVASTANYAFTEKLAGAIAQSGQKPEAVLRCTVDGEQYFVTGRYVDTNGWYIYSALPKKNLLRDLYQMSVILLITTASFLLILIPLSIFMIQNMMRPYRTMLQTFARADKFGIKTRLHLDCSNEIGVLANRFDHLLDNVEEKTREIFRVQAKLYELEISKNKIDLDALRSQINPHFLYNTLECMKGIGLVYDAQEIVRMTTSLSNVLRYSLQSDDFVTVEQELTVVSDYISIMLIRFGDKYSIEMNVDPEALACVMPRMILQPIVENAFVHGMEMNSTPGRLMIGVVRCSERLTFYIADNGVGMPEEKLLWIRKMAQGALDLREEHIGVANIIRRLALYYGDQAQFTVENRAEGGVAFTIEIPAMENPTLDFKPPSTV